MTEQEMRNLEEQIPLFANIAFNNAKKQALLNGLSVVESKDGWLIEIFPDGTCNKIKKIADRHLCVAGTYKI